MLRLILTLWWWCCLWNWYKGPWLPRWLGWTINL